MKQKIIFIFAFLCALSIPALAQENLQREAQDSQTKKTFTTVKELPISSVKNQYRSGTCWAYGTLGYFESEILRKSGKTYDPGQQGLYGQCHPLCAYARLQPDF